MEKVPFDKSKQKIDFEGYKYSNELTKQVKLKSSNIALKNISVSCKESIHLEETKRISKINHFVKFSIESGLKLLYFDREGIYSVNDNTLDHHPLYKFNQIQNGKCLSVNVPRSIENSNRMNPKERTPIIAVISLDDGFILGIDLLTGKELFLVNILNKIRHEFVIEESVVMKNGELILLLYSYVKKTKNSKDSNDHYLNVVRMRKNFSIDTISKLEFNQKPDLIEFIPNSNFLLIIQTLNEEKSLTAMNKIDQNNDYEIVVEKYPEPKIVSNEPFKKPDGLSDIFWGNDAIKNVSTSISLEIYEISEKCNTNLAKVSTLLLKDTEFLFNSLTRNDGNDSVYFAVSRMEDAILCRLKNTSNKKANLSHCDTMPAFSHVLKGKENKKFVGYSPFNIETYGRIKRIFMAEFKDLCIVYEVNGEKNTFPQRVIQFDSETICGITEFSEKLIILTDKRIVSLQME